MQETEHSKVTKILPQRAHRQANSASRPPVRAWDGAFSDCSVSAIPSAKQGGDLAFPELPTASVGSSQAPTDAGAVHEVKHSTAYMQILQFRRSVVKISTYSLEHCDDFFDQNPSWSRHVPRRI